MADEAIWLDVLPSMDKLGASLAKGVVKPARSAGQTGAKAMSETWSAGLATSVTADFTKSLEKQSDQLKKTIERERSTVVKARAAQSDATSKVTLAQQKLTDSVEKYGAGSAQALAAEQRLAAAMDRHEAATITLTSKQDQLHAAQREAKSLADELAAAQKNVAAETENVAKSFDGMDGLTDAAFGAGAAAGAALGKGLWDAVDTEGAVNRMSAQLALTEPESERIGAAAGALFSSAYGESMDEVSGAVTAVVGNIDGMRGASEETLTAISGQVMSLAGTFDQDLNQTTAAVGQMMRTGMAPDAQTALDLITAGLQSSTRAGEDLTDTLIEYPALFERLGLDGQTTMGLISQGMEAGARNTDLVADALKEFQIRATDGTEASAAGFEALGLSAEQMTAQIAAGGDGASQGLDTVLDKLRGMEDPVARNAAAVALFGTQAEDLGGALFALDPSSAVSALGDVSGAAAQVDKTANQGAGVALQELGRIMQTELATAASAALPYIKDGIGFLKEYQPIIMPAVLALGAFAAAVGVARVAMATSNVVSAIFAGLKGTEAATTGMSTGALIGYRVAQGASVVATNAATIATKAFNMALRANPIGLIITAVTLLVGALVWFFTQTETGKQIWQSVWSGIQAATSAVVSWFQTSVLPVLTSIWNGIAAGATWLYENVIQPVWSGIQAAVQFVVLAVQSYINLWVGIFRNVLAPVFTWLYGSIIQPIWAGIQLAIQIVIFAVQSYINLWVGIFRNVLAPAFTWLYQNVVLPVWNGIRIAISTVWVFLRDSVFKPLVAFLYDQVVVRFLFLRDQVLSVWATIRTGINTSWLWIRDNVLAPLVAFLYDQVIVRFQFMRDRVLDAWQQLRDGLKAGWDWIRTNVFDPVANIVKNTLPDAFETGKDAIGSIWDGLRELARKPIAFVVETIIRDGLVKPFNKVASFFGTDEIDEKYFTVPKLWTGGPVPGHSPSDTADNIPIMATAGEYMIRRPAVRRLERNAPGALAHINKTGEIPGYATGGEIVALGNALKPLGVRVTGHTAFPPVGRHTTNSEHYVDKAIDLNYGPGGENGIEKAFFDQLAPILHGLGWGVIWRYANHYDHLHVGTNQTPLGDWNRNGAGSLIAGGIASALAGLGNAAGALVDLNPFKGLIDKITSGVGDSPFAQMIAQGGKNIVSRAIDWMTEKMPFGASDTGSGDTGGFTGSGPARDQGLAWATAKGLSSSQWAGVDYIISKESGWRPTAKNPSSTASGLPQMINATARAYLGGAPASKYPVTTQLDGFWSYVNDRYGGIGGAVDFWKANHHYATGGPIEPLKYDDGGFLLPGLNLTLNKTRHPEPVFTDAQWALLAEAATGDTGDGDSVNIENLNVLDPEEVTKELELMLNRRRAKKARSRVRV